VKLLLYSWPFAPGLGGLERLSGMTALHAAYSGHEVTVVTATPDPKQRSGPFPFRVERRPSLRRLAALVRRADVVQLNTFSAAVMLLARLARRPVVWQHIDYDTLSPRGICHAAGQPCRFALGRCYACLRRDHSRLGAGRSILSLLVKRVATHLATVNLLSTQYAQARMPLPRAGFLSFGIDTDQWTWAPRATATELRVMFYGRHIPAKGCDVLVRAVRHCQDEGVPVTARIAGDGPHRERSEALARDLGLSDVITFLGFQPEERLIAELQQADVVAAPTLQDEIGQFVAFEAMACGCAVVASNIGALPEHLEGAGLLFPPGDDRALAKVLVTLARDRALLATVARRGRERVLANFDARAMNARYLELYSRLLARRGGSRAARFVG
jgi:glycosyltransferase involved in cell wall biosynthesis